MRPARAEPSTAETLTGRKQTDEDLKRALNTRLIEKQNKVPIRGKGKFNLTVPEPFF